MGNLKPKKGKIFKEIRKAIFSYCENVNERLKAAVVKRILC